MIGRCSKQINKTRNTASVRSEAPQYIVERSLKIPVEIPGFFSSVFNPEYDYWKGSIRRKP